MAGWIGLADHHGQAFDPAGLGRRAAGGKGSVPARNALLNRGSLVMELRMPARGRATQLVYIDRDGDWPFHFSLSVIPGGGLTMVMNQGGGVIHATINSTVEGPSDIKRFTFAWDAPARRGWVTLERPDQGTVQQQKIAAPGPVRLCDLRALLLDGRRRYLAPQVSFLALSDRVEPVGPTPTLTPDTPIATPRGYRPAGALRRGDTVLTAGGEVVPVLFSLSRTVPARGLFRPLRLRRPYFGLRRDATVAATQRLMLSGSDVEYMFGREAVLAECRHLTGSNSVVPAPAGPLVRYTQLLLPHHEAVQAAGTVMETLFVGRLRRHRERLETSILAGLDRNLLPEHGSPVHPVLRPFDAVTLANQRAA